MPRARGIPDDSSPFLYKADRAPPDPHHGRYLIDSAYALGCLAALGDDDAQARFETLADDARPMIRAALRNQFCRGFDDEEARGAGFLVDVEG